MPFLAVAARPLILSTTAGILRYRWRFFEGVESGTREVEAKHCIAGGEVIDQGLENICCASEAMHQYHQWTSATFFNKNSKAIGCGM
jgi:hypothetical protein